MKFLRLTAIVVLLTLFLLLSACGRSNTGNIHVLCYQMFQEQMQNIILNLDQYVGNTIQYEGMFTYMNFFSEPRGYHVVRYVEGCCAPVQAMGFRLDMGDLSPLAEGTWVKITGVLNWCNYFTVVLAVTDIEALYEQGQVFFVRP